MLYQCGDLIHFVNDLTGILNWIQYYQIGFQQRKKYYVPCNKKYGYTD